MNIPARQSRILIVDDDAATIRVLAHIVKDLGRIHFTTKGSEALGVAQSVMPDLILLDVEMPDMNGIDVCEQIKRDPSLKDVPILFVTSHADTEIEARALSVGAIDFIHKPPHSLVVQARVRNYLALKRQTDQLRMLSMVDGLTGIANRRAFDDAVMQEWRRACRSGSPLSLLMLDVDYFKRFNDTYGHQAGDDCLRAIAGTLAANVKRPGEMVARYGGEEFVVLLPNCSREHARALAERILVNVSELGIAHATSDAALHVTVSVGAESMESLCDNAGNCWRQDAIYRSSTQSSQLKRPPSSG